MTPTNPSESTLPAIVFCQWHGPLFTETGECPRCWPTLRKKTGEIECPRCHRMIDVFGETGQWWETGEIDEDGAPVHEPDPDDFFAPAGYHHGYLLVDNGYGQGEAYWLGYRHRKQKQCQPKPKPTTIITLEAPKG